MKRILSYAFFFIFSLVYTSCSTSYIPDKHSFGTQVRPTSELSQPQFTDQQLPQTTWDDLFRNSAGAIVDGYGLAMQIKIPRFSESFSDEPLFVVNDRTIGKGFETISHIDPNSVANIRILRRPNEISLYGNQGRHGVILIKTI